MTKIKTCKKIGVKNTYNIGMKSKYHNYLLNGVVSKNSHAVGYSMLTYATAYLKANYTLEYMTALINANSDDMDKLNIYIDECYKMGINVIAPDINKSGVKFEHDKETNSIVFGFNGIKGVGNSVIDVVFAERQNGKFTSLKNLLERIPSLNSIFIKNLIKCGAFDSIEQNAYKYLPMMEFTTKAKTKADYKNGKIGYWDCLIKTYIEPQTKQTKEYKQLEEEYKSLSSSKKEDKEKRAVLKEEMQDLVDKAIVAFNNSTGEKPPIAELKANELELLGFPISYNPKKELISLSDFINNTSVYDIKNSNDYQSIFYFMGRVKSCKATKNGSYFVVLSDDTDDITTFIKRETYLMMEDQIKQQGNYFRISGRLNQSRNPNFPDSLHLESIRYFNCTKDSKITLKMPNDTSAEMLKDVFTRIKNELIIKMSPINMITNVMVGDKIFSTKIDYWISNINDIADVMIRHNITAIKS